MSNKPELLAPAGDRDALVAAVQSGADAVYLGAGGFNARQSAGNFADERLNEAVQYCHARNVRVHVTLNTMVRDEELPALEETVRAIASAGADAVLVQDFGVARAVKQIVPDMALHASTQMAVHNRAGVEFLAREGFSRVVLAREMSLKEIHACAGLGIELEAFVHGALCVSCSGQCLFSSLVGGRSGNRGRCAQPCRLRYRLDDREGYLLSTKDLCALKQLDELRDAGVDSFKIEGRLKRPEYVAAVTAAYRAAIDRPEAPRDARPLRQMFNRGGFTKGYLPGVEDSELMYAERPNHLGVPVGIAQQNGWVRLDADIAQADALALRRANQSDRPVRLSGCAGETAACPSARKGDALIRLVSESQMAAARASCAGEHRQIDVRAALTLRVGQPMRLEISDGEHRAQALGEPVQPAKSRGLDAARAKEQIGKTGGTPYRLVSIALDADENAFCPASALNALRRTALEELTRLRMPAPLAVHPLRIPPREEISSPRAPEILVQSGDANLLRSAGALGADGVIFAPEDVRPEALDRAANVLPEHFSLALPMVLPQSALETLQGWAQQLDGRIRRVYLSNVGQFDFSWPGERCADFSLNIANRLALEQLRGWGCTRYTPSVELNAQQIEALSGCRELIVHGRLPLMQLRHCPYRAAHGLPGRHADCTRCDRCPTQDRVGSKVLTDRTGAQFPLRRLVSGEGCVVQVLNCVPLMLLRRAGRLPKAAAWRLLIDRAEELESTLRLYRLAARGEDFRSDPAWRDYESMNTTTGHYFRGAE